MERMQNFRHILSAPLRNRDEQTAFENTCTTSFSEFYAQNCLAPKYAKVICNEENLSEYVN